MRKGNFRYFKYLFLLLAVMVIMSCSLPFIGAEADPTNTPMPTNPPLPTNPPPTNPPPPTWTPPPTYTPPAKASPTSQPKASPTSEASDFFTEEFDNTLNDWTLFFTSGYEDQADVYTDEGRLKFYLDGEYIWAYVVYDPYYYSDVMLTAYVENRGFNNNNVSLICRYDPDYGWYEFNIANNGLYWIYFFDEYDDAYYEIHDGGSTSIHTGKTFNEYTIICEDDNLILYINGVETARITERKYALKEGYVGVSVSSFDVYPIDVEFEWVEISLP